MAASSKADKPKPVDKKVFDVAKPGKTQPSTTTRPIIVGHKPMIKDPMVNPNESNPDLPARPEESNINPTRSTKEIVPPSSDEKKSEAPTTVEAPAEEVDSNDAAPDVKPTEETETPAANETVVIDTVAAQVASKKKADEVSEEEIKKQEAIAKLIVEKTYNVPIGQAHHRRNQSVRVIVAVVVVLGVLAALAAADAGLINLPFQVPFDFIK